MRRSFVKKPDRSAELLYQNAEKAYFEENISEKRKELILKKIEDY